MKRSLLFAVVALSIAPIVCPAAAVVPPEEAARTTARIVGFDRSLAGGTVRLIVVAADDASSGSAERLVAAFRADGFDPELFSEGDLPSDLGSQTLVFVEPEAVTDELVEKLERAGVLTVTSDPAPVEAGRIAVGLEESSGRVGIVIHDERLDAQGHVFSAQLLKLARIVTGEFRTLGQPEESAEAEIAISGQAGVESPTLVDFPTPSYPPAARRLRVEGDVVVRLLVDEEGRVLEAELVKGVPQDVGINEAALSAAKDARFRPGRRDGQPVKVWHTITIPFRI